MAAYSGARAENSNSRLNLKSSLILFCQQVPGTKGNETAELHSKQKKKRSVVLVAAQHVIIVKVMQRLFTP